MFIILLTIFVRSAILFYFWVCVLVNLRWAAKWHFKFTVLYCLKLNFFDIIWNIIFSCIYIYMHLSHLKIIRTVLYTQYSTASISICIALYNHKFHAVCIFTLTYSFLKNVLNLQKDKTSSLQRLPEIKCKNQ